MAGPFKMKGSPMQRNFGIGASPLRNGETNVKREAPPKTEIKKDTNVKKGDGETPGGGKFEDWGQVGKPIVGAPIKVDKPKKKKAGWGEGWFGLPDVGITEALDKFKFKKTK